MKKIYPLLLCLLLTLELALPWCWRWFCSPEESMENIKSGKGEAGVFPNAKQETMTASCFCVFIVLWPTAGRAPE